MQGLVSRIAIGVFGLLTIAMLLLAVFDERGALAVQHRRQELDNLNKDIEKAEEDNDRYRKTIENLRSNPDEIERRAREEFNLVREGEVIIKLPETAPAKKDQPATDKESPNTQK